MDASAEVDHLAAERSAARFDVEAMKVAWAGSRHAVEVGDRMARLVASDPVSDCFLDPLLPPIPNSTSFA
jgi:acyl-CoA oxidase